MTVPRYSLSAKNVEKFKPVLDELMKGLTVTLEVDNALSFAGLLRDAILASHRLNNEYARLYNNIIVHYKNEHTVTAGPGSRQCTADAKEWRINHTMNFEEAKKLLYDFHLSSAKVLAIQDCPAVLLVPDIERLNFIYAIQENAL